MSLVFSLYDWPLTESNLTDNIQYLVERLDLRLSGLQYETDNRTRRTALAEDWSNPELSSENGFVLYDQKGIYDSFVWLFASDYVSVDIRERYRRMTLYSERSSVSMLKKALPAATDLKLFFGPYGYAVDWKASDGPPLSFMFAIEMTPEDVSDEALAFSLANDSPNVVWGDLLLSADNPCLDGYFRDIYDLNIITRKHLDAKLGDATLRHYIKVAPETFGNLSVLSRDTYAWAVDRRNIDMVRSVFIHEGRLLAPDIGYL